MPVLKIVDELGVLRPAHITGPHYLRSIKVGFIIDKLVITDFVIGRIANNNELASRVLTETL
jgi:hypothetical protein